MVAVGMVAVGMAEETEAASVAVMAVVATGAAICRAETAEA